MMVSLGIDIGGTGCKCVAFREDGRQLALSYLEYPNPPGKTNLEAAVLQNAVFGVTADCVRQLDDASSVRAITVSSFGESFVPIDREGRPLTDVLMYFANSESAEFDRMVASIGAERFMDVARILPDASYSLAKMLYTRRVAERPVWKYLFIASFLCWCLSGEAVCDASLACRSLLYDVRAGRWSPELLAATGIDEAQLPQIIPTGGAAGTLLPEAARQLGLKEDVLVVIGSHDQIVNALGAGVHRSGEAVNATGTSECITPLFTAMPGLEFVRNNFACVPYLQKAGYVTYAYNISGGSVVRWFRDVLALHLRQESAERHMSVYDLFNERCPREPTRLLVLPYLQGMGGTPDVRAAATAAISGLTTATTLPDLYRGILEGLCYEMRYNLEKLGEVGIQPTHLYACGGGARSLPWLQIKADVWGCGILPVKTEETGALGSAILGFAAATGEKDCFSLARRFVQHGDMILPQSEYAGFYQSQYETYKKLRAFYLEEMY